MGYGCVDAVERRRPQRPGKNARAWSGGNLGAGGARQPDGDRGPDRGVAGHRRPVARLVAALPARGLVGSIRTRVAAAGLAVWQARRQASTDRGTTTGRGDAGGGAVDGRDGSVTGGAGPTAGRDATSIVGGQGQTAEQIANILHPPLPADAAAGRGVPAPWPVSNLPPPSPTVTGRQGAAGHLGAQPAGRGRWRWWSANNPLVESPPGWRSACWVGSRRPRSCSGVPAAATGRRRWRWRGSLASCRWR